MSFWESLRQQLMYLWEQFQSSSAIVKIATVTVVMIWLVACTMLMVALGFLWERPVVAQLPTPGPDVITIPMISLEPTAGPVDTPIIVTGQGWRPGETIMIYLAPPDEIGSDDFAVNSVIVDAQGGFEVLVPLLAGQDWQIPGLVRVIARNAEGKVGAQAFFSLIEGTSQPITATTPSPEPTDSLTPAAQETATTTPVAQPSEPQLTAQVDLNIRSGPGTAYAVLGLLRTGQSAEITGVSQDGRWWQIEFAASSDDHGWVAAQYVTAQNTSNIPVVQAAPLPPTATPIPAATPQSTPTPVVITDWRAEYYNNATMSGNPVLIRNDVDISFDWGRGSPGPNVPVDNFSARWTRSLYFPAGAYRFTVRADDGVLVWVDDRLIIDQWHDSSPRIYTADVNLADGLHSLKMAFYERTGDAIAQLRWERLSTFPDWKGEYFSNPNLSGSPVVIRNDPQINFNWGTGSPASGIPVDNFSVRWSRDVYFKAGTYRFTVRVDDGIRIWVDGNLVVDQWHDNDGATYVVEVNLPEGSRNVRVEYYDSGYEAIAELEWGRVESYPDWKAEYFNNRNLQGNPVLVRNEDEIDHDWDEGSPSNEVPVDNFSARWTRRVDFSDATYLFQMKVDDGARLWFDDELIIDGWEDGNFRLLEATRKVSKGRHRLRLEYYERRDEARIELEWERQPDQPANQLPQAVPGGPYNVNEGSQLVLDGRGSKDPDGIISLYEWDLNYDGSSFNADLIGPAVANSFPDGPAMFTIALRVTDNKGASQIATTQVTVVNVAPVAEAGGPYNGRVGQPILFAGSGVDAGLIDQSGLLYTWDFGDNSTANGQTVTHNYTQAGSYNVTLTVTDKDGSRSNDTAAVQVASALQAPQAVINGPVQGIVGEALNFNGSGSSDSDGNIVQYAWNFGDGTTGAGVNVAHTYSITGTYTLKLVVTDNDGLTGTASQVVQINEPSPGNLAPAAVIVGPSTGLVGEVLTFNGTNSSDSDGTIISYSWDFKDGTIGSGAVITHTYPISGSYQVVLTVTDNGGLSGSAAQTVQINDVTPQPKNPNDQTGTENNVSPQVAR